MAEQSDEMKEVKRLLRRFASIHYYDYYFSLLPLLELPILNIELERS
jgi:hypothetical protein